MFVIAKMYAVNDPRRFGNDQQVDLTCVCDDRLMSGNEACRKAALENSTFNQASPNGDCRFNCSITRSIRRQEEFYLIFARQAECLPFDGAEFVAPLRCESVTDYGGTSKRVDVCTPYNPDVVHPRQLKFFNLRMTIDNPRASVVFEPGKGGYWVGIYPADRFTMDEALADATRGS